MDGIYIQETELDKKFDDGLMSPDEYAEYTYDLDKKSGIRTSWYSYDEYLGIPSERVRQDRLTTPDYDELCWKYYRERLEKENKI